MHKNRNAVIRNYIKGNKEEYILASDMNNYKKILFRNIKGTKKNCTEFMVPCFCEKECLFVGGDNDLVKVWGLVKRKS